MKIKTITILTAIAAMTVGCSKKQTISLETTTVTEGDISETVTATGTVESVTTVDVGTQVTGIISALYADYNSEVKANQIIAEIDKTVLESTLRSANANMESAKQTYEYQKANYERDKQLHEKKLISDYEFEGTRRDYLVAKADYEKSQADIVSAQRNLSYAEIYAPIDGIVIAREVEVGQTVVSSMTVANLFTIADLDHMRVIGDVDEADIGQVKVGQRVIFTVDAYPNDKFEGSVSQVRLSPTTESNVVTYEVVVDTSNPDHKLIPGLTANLTIYTLEETDVLSLPVKALRFTPQEYPEAEGLPAIAENGIAAQPIDEGSNKRVVYTLKDNTLHPTEITIGTDNGINVVITSGLNKGDKVATGYTSEAPENAEEDSNESSPFMPSRPGRDKKK